MRLELTDGQAFELEALLGVTLREMSHEIAATDNAGYRADLLVRRLRLAEVAAALRPRMEHPPVVDGDAVARELSHPGG